MLEVAAAATIALTAWWLGPLAACAFLVVAIGIAELYRFAFPATPFKRVLTIVTLSLSILVLGLMGQRPDCPVNDSQCSLRR